MRGCEREDMNATATKERDAVQASYKASSLSYIDA
jgi:hypothetical protein